MKFIPLTDIHKKKITSMAICHLLDEKGIGYLLSSVKIIEVEPKKLLLRKGTTGEELFIVLHGEVMVWDYEDGEVKVFAHLKDEDLFGEMSAILHTPRSANISSVTSSTIVVLLKKHIAGLIEINPQFKEFLSQLGLHREQENLENLF